MVHVKRTRTQNFVFALVILSIILLSTVFHFPVHFENALLQSPATEYAVEISVWRIIFEPILGPLLYLNRSLYALREVPLTLFWGLTWYVALSVAQIYRKTGSRKGVAYKKLADLPSLIGLCFTIFIVILFVPLPNNTIVNNSKDRVLLTTHAHTEFSHDGLISQTNMWEWHKKNGFDAFFITDHANYQKSLEFSQEQKNGAFPIEPLVLVGQEFSGTNHMSLLELNGKFHTEGMEDKAVIDSVHHYGGAVIVNHWFDGKGKGKAYYEELGVDGFEIENSGKSLYYDRKLFRQLIDFCKESGLIMIGGLDFHGYGRVCSLYNALEIPDWNVLDYKKKEQAILNILKKGPQEKVKVLLYKDRPYYADSNLWLRPFLTAVNYFRTLNFAQVLSWTFWLWFFQFMANRAAKTVALKSNRLLFLSFPCAVFLMVLGGHYYFLGKAVAGYSEVYTEYSHLLVPIGLGLLLYCLALAYFRVSKSKTISKRISVNKKYTE